MREVWGTELLIYVTNNIAKKSMLSMQNNAIIISLLKHMKYMHRNVANTKIQCLGGTSYYSQ